MKKIELIIFTAGHHAAGKTEICNYLKSNYCFNVVETGRMVRSIYKERSSSFYNLSLGDFVKVIESSKPGYFNKKLMEEINSFNNNYDNFVINGMRTLENINQIKEKYPYASHYIIWVESPFPVLYERYKTREKEDLTEESFESLLEFDESLGLDSIKKNADLFIVNNSDLESLYKKVDLILKEIETMSSDFDFFE